MGNIFSKTKFTKIQLAISKQGLKINGVLYKANIQFDINEIIICDEGKENDDWFNELFENPHDFKKYGKYSRNDRIYKIGTCYFKRRIENKWS